MTSFKDQLRHAVESHKRGDWGTALDIYESLLEREPDDHRVVHLAGQALLGRHENGDLQRSLELFERAIRLEPGKAAYYNDLGTARWNRRELELAQAAFLKALQLDENFIQASFNLGNCYWLAGRVNEALAAYRRVVELQSDWILAHYMIANCLVSLGKPGAALGHYEKSLQRADLQVDASLGLSAALLKLGRWREGWEHFECRKESPVFDSYRRLAQPEWTGEADRRCKLLVYGEQGLGDLIQYARFLPEVRRRVGSLKLVCDRRLHGLFARSSLATELIDKDGVELERIGFDKRVASMSLTRILNIRPDNVPAPVPYLKVDSQRIGQWEQRIGGGCRNVGLVWTGNPAQKDDRFRSARLADLAPLLDLEGVRFFALQKGWSARPLDGMTPPNLADLSDQILDFDDTAALVSALDLVITVDTSTAHLCGALGRPVWNLLWTGHCWRYLSGRSDTPWYPSMRLFHQHAIGDWSGVVREVGAELEHLIKAG